MLTPFLFILLLLPFPADRDLDKVIDASDTQGTISRIQQLVAEQQIRSLTVIAEAIGAVEATAEGQWHHVDRYRVFTGAIRALASLPGQKLAVEIPKVMGKSKQWPSRVFLLELSLQSDLVDSVQLALQNIDDKAPQVARVAARILGHSQEIVALEPLISAMSRWEESRTRESAARGGREGLSKRARDRAWLSCRDALHRLTGLSLHGAIPYKNWIAAHRDEIDPSKVDLDKVVEKSTGVGLFGLELTGKNIAFILDVSGSMLATDPPSEEAIEIARRSTGVGDNVEQKLQELMEKRRRIIRARTQLCQAINGLGDERRFTVIPFSSEVNPWSDVLLESSRKNRKSAVQFVQSLKASGITVTDEALARALSDPTLDTIYLITDGAPTHIGSQGDQLPIDAKMLMKRIVEETRALNHLRGIRIFTLGFIDAEEEFLKRLARENSGKYVRIR